MKTILALPALLLAGAAPFVATPAAAQLSLNISVNFAPPGLPVYDQPPIPGPDYIWAPGYWAWDNYVQDYYWIPGTWVMAPRPGLLWTPPWWGWQDGTFLFHSGYWGPHVGFYGGVPYGFGYTGSGFQGAYWNGGHVYYNRSVTNITNVNVTNVYNKTVIVNRVTNVSYNGGPGGVEAKPSPAEQAAMREPRLAPTPVQQQHFQAARANKQLFASANHGRPPIAAAPRAGQLGGPGIIPTRQAAPYHPPAQAAAARGSRLTVPDAEAHGTSPVAPAERPPHGNQQGGAKPEGIGRDDQQAAHGHPQPAPEGNPEAVRPSGEPGSRDGGERMGAGQPDSGLDLESRRDAAGDVPPRVPQPRQAFPSPRGEPTPRAARVPHPQSPHPRPQSGGRPKPSPHKDEHHPG